MLVSLGKCKCQLNKGRPAHMVLEFASVANLQGGCFRGLENATGYVPRECKWI